MSRTAAQRLIALAAKQHQVVTLGQAIGLGIPKSSFYRMVKRGWFAPRYPGVFVRTGTEQTSLQTAIAATFACGSPAWASHHTAARVWGFEVPILSQPEVTVGIDRRPTPEGVHVHRTRRTRSTDFTTYRGVPISTPMRTILDIGERTSEEDLGIAVDSAHRRRLLSIPAFTAYLTHASNLTQPSSHVLRALVALRDPDRPMESTLESKLFQLLASVGLPLPVPQYWVDTRKGPRRIDFAYPDLKIAIEADGYETRFGIDRFNDERIRQNEVEEIGWSFRRFTWTHVEDHPMEVVTTFAIALGVAPTRWAPARW